MSLPEEHVQYPRRRYGADQDRYDWPRTPRAATWPNGAALACTIVVPLEFHRLDPTGKPFKHPGAMQTAYPDLRHFTTRDYGNRVGAFRLLRALKEAGLTATFPVNAILLERVRPLIDAIVRDGHEIAAYGWEADALHWSSLSIDEERALIAKTRAAFDAAGLKPRAWMSPARQQSFATLDLIREAGFDVCLDWESDCAPLALRTGHGAVVAVSTLNELDDRKLLIDQRQSEAEWRDQILEAARYSVTAADREGAQSFAFTLTPYVTGQPFRIWAVRELLQMLATMPGLWCASASAIADASRP
ncbi:MAG: polysaccharide deacetylase family protein [Hyphomonadaceae bacterium]|nr:polysaccharide deacetylase family protein [Hyphomonadaceae bacterium]